MIPRIEGTVHIDLYFPIDVLCHHFELGIDLIAVNIDHYIRGWVADVYNKGRPQRCDTCPNSVNQQYTAGANNRQLYALSNIRTVVEILHILVSNLILSFYVCFPSHVKTSRA